jgi:signal transduction histidine kinase
MKPFKEWQRMTKSPTIRLLAGLLVTLLAVAGFSSYSLHQLTKLRELQNQTIDLNRHDSLVLLRIQNDVNVLGTKVQEMTEHRKIPVGDYRQDFENVRQDLTGAIRTDEQFAEGLRRPVSAMQLGEAVRHFWILAERVFAEAQAGRESQARRLADRGLMDQQIALARQVSKLLEANNVAEEGADQKIASIYEGAERDIYVFLIAVMCAIVLASGYLIYSNKRIFAQIENLSAQRRILAARLISVQEEVLRSVSRELHDEFGQILTAVSAMLARAEKKGGLPPDSPFRTELSEVREITHTTLEKMRSLSQMLHPAILDDYGLAKGLEWYAGIFERQTGVETSVHIDGPVESLTGPRATHCFRIVQEALTNAAKHSGSKRATVTLTFHRDDLTVEITDFGVGIPANKKRQRPGLGLIAMHERAEILCGQLSISSRPGGGTTVSLTMPLRDENEQALGDIGAEEMNEVLFRES